MELPFPFYNYAPYTRSFLGFTIYNDNESLIPAITSIEKDVDKTQSVDHKHLDTTSPDHDRTFSSFTDIDLYRQPVLTPIVSLLVIPISQLILVLTGMLIQLRTLQMMRRETSVNSMMMVTQAKIHIIFWPIWAIAVILTESFYPLVLSLIHI